MNDREQGQVPHADFDTRLVDRIKAELESEPADSGNDDLPDWLETHTGIQRCADEIRQGGLGKVGRYRDQKMNREVAVKFLNQDLGTEHRRRFFREMRITATLDHPGVVPVYSSGAVAGRPYYSMRFVQGQTLAEAIREFHASSDNQLKRENSRFRSLIESFKAACTIIHFAHEQKGIWHRDIKPQNIMIDNGKTIVVDWGLAKSTSESPESPDALSLAADDTAMVANELTHTGQYMGTPAYMAPEQALGQTDRIDSRTDIYGLGATFFELLTGRPPHRIEQPWDLVTKPVGDDTSLPADAAEGSKSNLAVLKRIGTSPTPGPRQFNAKIASELDSICVRAMSRNRRDRYQTAQQIADDLDNWLVQSDVAAHSYSMVEKLQRWFRRNSKLVGAISIAALLVALITAISLVSVSFARQRADLALKRFTTERDQRIDHQLKAYAAAPPIQAEPLLNELRSFVPDELDRGIDRYLERLPGEKDQFRIRLLSVNRRPDTVLPLLRLVDPNDVAQLSLLVHAVNLDETERGPVVQQLVQNSSNPELATRVAVLLAKLAPRHPNWERLSPVLVQQLLASPETGISQWATMLEPAARHLKPELLAWYDGRRTSDPDKRQHAADFLLHLCGSDVPTLVVMIEPAGRSMFKRLMTELARSPQDARRELLVRRQETGAGTRPFRGPKEIVESFEAANGWITDSFAICEAMPWATFQQLGPGLKRLGYRPTRIQRGVDADDQPRVAAIWIRDNVDFLVESDCPADQVAKRLDEQRVEHWVPCDLSVLAEDNRISYTLVFRKALGDPNEYRVLVDNPLEQHKPLSRKLGGLGFQQLNHNEVVNADGQLSITALYCRYSDARINRPRVAISKDLRAPFLAALEKYLLLDVRYGPRGLTRLCPKRLKRVRIAGCSATITIPL